MAAAEGGPFSYAQLIDCSSVKRSAAAAAAADAAEAGSGPSKRGRLLAAATTGTSPASAVVRREVARLRKAGILRLADLHADLYAVVPSGALAADLQTQLRGAAGGAPAGDGAMCGLTLRQLLAWRPPDAGGAPPTGGGLLNDSLGVGPEALAAAMQDLLDRGAAFEPEPGRYLPTF